MAEKLEQVTEVQANIEKRTAERKPAAKPNRKPTARKAALKPAMRPARQKTARPEEGVSIIGTVQTVIDTNPGIDFKSLQEKTGLGDKQIRNTIAQLKKQGKITTKGRGVYHPAVTRELEAPKEQAQI